MLTYKTGKQVKHTIKDRKSFMDTICFIQDNQDIIALLSLCKTILDKATIESVSRLYAPTKQQKEESQKKAKACRQWYESVEVDHAIEKMVNNSSFLSFGITQKEVDTTISKDVQKLYAMS